MILLIVGSVALVSVGRAAEMAPASEHKVSFESDVKPILESACWQCHGDERPKGGLNLKSRETLMKGGDYGAAVIPGDSAKSPLIQFVSHLEEDMEMPPLGKGDKLSDEQVGILRAWIDQGLPWEAKEEEHLRVTLAPTVGAVMVDGDENEFRRQFGRTDGASGGLGTLEWTDRLKDGTRMALSAKALFGDEDYEVKLSLRRPEAWFVEAGFDQFRRYYDDTGGYHGPLGLGPVSLNRDLYVDQGRAWIDLGLTLPEWPRVVIGYEYRYRNGTKSMLQWGALADSNFNTRSIFPATKDIDEDTHIVKVDLSKAWNGFLFEDSFRGEFHESANRRRNVDFARVGSAVPDSVTRTREDYDSFHGANTFRVEKKVKKWWLLSGGYFYSRLDADAATDVGMILPTDPSIAPFGDFTRQILFERNSHIANFNSMWGPWHRLVVFTGVQQEWTRQKGNGDAFVFSAPTGLGSDLDRVATDENVGLRYTGIPLTVIHVDGRFQQETIGRRENQFIDDDFDEASDFLRNSDADGDTKEYQAGMTISPWNKASLSTSYRRRLRQNEYSHLVDTDRSTFWPSGNGFPAFIRERDTSENEFKVKLTVRPVTWWTWELRYGLSAVDYRTVTEGVQVDGVDIAGGRILAGNYDANTFGVSTTVTPWHRLHLTAGASYSDIRLISGVNDERVVAPYDGTSYYGHATANFIVGESIDWLTTYSLAGADFGQGNDAEGLPLGSVFDRHGVVTGFTKRFKNDLSVRLQYGFYRFSEPFVGHANDFQAHAISLTMTKVFQ